MILKTIFMLLLLQYSIFASDNSNLFKMADLGFMYNKHFNKKLPKMSLERDNKLHPTLLYFFSTSVTERTLENFLVRANKLKDIKSYIVFRGFSDEARNMLIRHKKRNFLVKIHPILYKDLGIKKVPAVVYALCPDEFREKQCKYLFRMDGDMSLNTFFKEASKKDENLLQYYNILEDGADDENKSN